jgi:hypothetical protein
LGKCDFARQFEYKWENENLLSALFSVPKPWTGYRWEWDTRGFPWVVNLRALPTEATSEIRYAKNLDGINKKIDATKVITRIYPLGYGEGDNQLGIESANDGLPYIDAPTASTYGLKATILADKRFESAETLKEYAQKILSEAKEPYITYEIGGVDIYGLTGQNYDKYNVGDIIKVVDEDEIFYAPVIAIEKSNVMMDPLNVSLTIANKAQNLAESINSLQERANINDLYAQGATNQLIVSFNDNADKDNPATMRLYIPDTMVRVNSCVLNFEFRPFRAYEQGVASTSQTTQATSSQSQQTPSTTTEASQSESTNSAVIDVDSTELAEINLDSTEDGGGEAISGDVKGGSGYNRVDPTTMELDGEFRHDHLIPNWRYAFDIPDHYHRIYVPRHRHSVSLPGHRHTVTIPGHNHEVTIPGHSHSVTIPGHSHPMEYGIYEDATAQSGRLYINGVYRQDVEPNTDYNLAPLLADAETGTISRNTWQRIEIYPVGDNRNTQALTGISANIFLQIFTNSRGSGDF